MAKNKSFLGIAESCLVSLKWVCFVTSLRYCLPFILLQQFVGFLQKRGTCSNCRNWFVITACLRQLTIVLRSIGQLVP
ncbi:hypothetical protein LOK49_LG08G02843 [Camellia lanceoleosa]|uniref:Uncharacterized protein n=1 Tax=Camellia lanceoleosa TaxID=1840588 RepID=A0ACC0GYW9_9ERIC|nr:hypothetical protein LOK49_LG08G02843 [Camellia lanceoleosa]